MTLACTPGTRASTRREWRRERPTGGNSYRVVEGHRWRAAALKAGPPDARPRKSRPPCRQNVGRVVGVPAQGHRAGGTARGDPGAGRRRCAAGPQHRPPPDPGVRRASEPGTHSSAKLLDPLSIREREVLIEVAGGWSNSEIGERLHISAATAKTHVSRLLMKLDVHDRAQLVMIAYETGLVTPS